MAQNRNVAVIVGSLRKESLNRKLALALAGMAPEGLKLQIAEIGALPLYAAVEGLTSGRLQRVLPGHRLYALDIHALYPSRRFLDAKIKTWIDFLKEELPERLQLENRVLEDQRYWAKD